LNDGGVVTVGRINAGKGQDQLVDALALLRDRGIVLRASIAGDVFAGAEVYRDRLRQRIDAAGLSDAVALLGFVDDVEGLLARHSIFVMPSRRPESFGLALVEAMAAGLACVATNVGGPVEIVDDGVNGLLVPPGDPVRLADALEKLCTDETLRRTLGVNAARDVRARFAIGRTVDAVEGVYRELLARRTRRGP
jgi:glycosyltransferase involved in cell wall biosynthesis